MAIRRILCLKPIYYPDKYVVIGHTPVQLLKADAPVKIYRRDNLKTARNRVGLSQELVAERLGVSRQAVTKWEAGQSRPNARNLQALAELYQISAEELLADGKKGPNLILRTNLIRWAIILQAAFLYSCVQEVYQIRMDPDDPVYQGSLVFSLVLLALCSIWMASNHRYEPDMVRRRKNVNIELAYCTVQTAAALLTMRFGMGLVGLALILLIMPVYILYINPKFMGRRFTR